MGDKVIPIKYGGPHDNVEAHANLETGKVEKGPWGSGPSNGFNATSEKIISRPSDDEYRANYKRIFGHD